MFACKRENKKIIFNMHKYIGDDLPANFDNSPTWKFIWFALHIYVQLYSNNYNIGKSCTFLSQYEK